MTQSIAYLVLSAVALFVVVSASDAMAQKVVFLTGDDEYRSEESMPMIARILERDYGFETKVGFSVDEDGTVNPRAVQSITGTEELADADLMVLFLRFREPSDEVFQRILDYIDSGNPVVGFRTATHAFRFPRKTDKAKSWNHRSGPVEDYPKKYADHGVDRTRELLGQSWITHHGSFKEFGGKLTDVAPADNSQHPIVNGIEPFSVHSWLYHVQGGGYTLSGDPEILLNGTATRSEKIERKQTHIFPLTNPVAWTKEKSDRAGRVFTTTLGHPFDFREPQMRRLAIQGILWALGKEGLIPKEGVNADTVGVYDPNAAGVRGAHKQGLKPAGFLKPEPRMVSDSQAEWYEKYKDQDNIPALDTMLLNRDPEPDLNNGFVNLYNEKDLAGWTARGGDCLVEADGEKIVGTCVVGAPSTYLCTDRSDYRDFVFTAEIKWIVDGNTGIMFRAKARPGKKQREEIYGPQAEMEGHERGRGWSGGIFGQSCGGYFYPLWLDQHEQVRGALKEDDWNRITIQAKGDTVKTWVNGKPAAHWLNTEYTEGFFGLQVHAGKKGQIEFRSIKVKEINSS